MPTTKTAAVRIYLDKDLHFNFDTHCQTHNIENRDAIERAIDWLYYHKDFVYDWTPQISDRGRPVKGMEDAKSSSVVPLNVRIHTERHQFIKDMNVVISEKFGVKPNLSYLMNTLLQQWMATPESETSTPPKIVNGPYQKKGYGAVLKANQDRALTKFMNAFPDIAAAVGIKTLIDWYVTVKAAGYQFKFHTIKQFGEFAKRGDVRSDFSGKFIVHCLENKVDPSPGVFHEWNLTYLRESVGVRFENWFIESIKVNNHDLNGASLETIYAEERLTRVQEGADLDDIENWLY